MKSLKKSVSVLLCVILALGVFGVVPFSVSAAATTWAALQTEINTTGIVTLSTDITAADEDKGIKIDSGRNVIPLAAFFMAISPIITVRLM